jgi:hypothetical protein
MQNNFVGPPLPQNHHFFVGPPEEKMIIVDRGIPRTESSTGPSDRNIRVGPPADPGKRGKPGDPPGRNGSFRDAGMPAVVRNRLAHARAAAAAANANAGAGASAAAANAAAAAQAAAFAQQQAAIAQQVAQQQAAAAAAAVAHQLAQQEAAETARQFAEQQAEEAFRQLAQEQAEAAAQHLAQQQAENARLTAEAEADAKAHAQATLQAVIAAPSFTPASRAAALAFEMAIKTATLQFLSSAARALGPVSLAFYPSELGNSDLRPANTSTPTAPPGIDALGPTSLPAASPLPSSYPGGKVVSNPTQNETLPGVDPADANASIPGRPADAELPSPDVMFKDRRDDPGIAGGYGESISGTWLGDATRGSGAPIPSHIADQLRGREFSNFHRFREAFWKAVAQDPQLSKRMNRINLRQLQAGKPPFALIVDQTGGRVKLELHHKDPIAQGGTVYHMDNLVVLTPKRHIELHKDEN